MQQNSRCRLCGDRDETINRIISEYSNLAQWEYNMRHAWMGKVIHLELCKRFEFEHMNNPESVLETVLENEIQMDHLISARRPDLVIVTPTKKKKKINTKRELTE